MSSRIPSVAGSFYPGSEPALTRLLEDLYRSEEKKIGRVDPAATLIGGVVPHAGYVYSGYEAMHFFHFLKNPERRYDTFVIVNPNHTGMGEDVEADAHDSWESPLGSVPLDTEFIRALELPVARRAQQKEHSAEVMLPFLQYVLDYPFRIAPVCMLRQDPDSARLVAERIRSAQQRLDRKILLIASSDFSHYVEPEFGRQQDDLVLEQVRRLDTGALYAAVRKHNISVCGYGPIMSLIDYAGLVTKNPKTTVLARGNSGKSGRPGPVVDYVSILFHT